MNLTQKVEKIKKQELTAVENVIQFGKKIEELKDLNIFLKRNENALEKAKEIDKKIKNNKQVGKLAGLCFAVKSNICVKGLETNCASKVLENFVAPFNATIINKLIAEDAIILGMVNMDEFACGASGETSAFEPTKNPINKEMIPGGSSSGSAAAVSAELCDFSLGSDTGGSIRNPASHCNIVGLKPTYGSVSRYGLIDMTMSFDVIGPLTKNSEDSKLIYGIIKGQDNFDSTTQLIESTKKEIKTIGLVDVSDFTTPEIQKIIEDKTSEIAKQNNYKIKKIKLPLDIAIQTYYLLVYVEFFSATRKFDGRRFGFKIEDKAGEEVLRRIFGGEEITKAEHKGRHYNKALNARKEIKQQFEKIFKEVDAIVLPTVPKLAHKIGKKITPEEMYAYDVFTCLPNISGNPAISIPAGFIEEDKIKKPIGLQIIAPHFEEETLFSLGEKIQELS